MTLRLPKWLLLAAAFVLTAAAGAGIALLVASTTDLGATTTSTETDVRTTTQTSTETTTEVPDGIAPGLLGYDVVSDLQETGAIGGFTPVVPRVGWDSEFELDRGGAVVRFRGRFVRWTYFDTAAGREVHAALQQVAEEHDYTVENL